MPGANTLLQQLPAFMGQVELIKKRQSTDDIIRAIKKYHNVDCTEYDNICIYFLGNGDYETGRNIYRFLKDNVRYDEEGVMAQTIRTPAAIIATGKTVGADCKNYSLFTGGVLDALNREGQNINWCYRFAGYDYGSDSVGHVFVVINPNTENEIWVDAVMNSYDYKGKQPLFYQDKKFTAMPLYRISGVNSKPAPVNNAAYGELHLPVNLDGYTTNDAMAHAALKMNLEREAAAEMQAGLLKPGTARYDKYNRVISEVDKKIARFETSNDWNFNKSMQQRIAGGLISILYGSDQLKTLQQSLPAIAMDFLYLYIPIVDDPAFYKRWCPKMTHDYKSIMPPVVTHKRNMAGQTSWQWGAWGGFHPEDDVYPLLYSLLTGQLGMAPEVFWSKALGLPITKEDNGVFSGLEAGSNDDVGPLADMLNQSIAGAIKAGDEQSGGGVSQALTYVKGFLKGIIGKLEMKPYQPEQFTPNENDWTGSKWSPFASGFPPQLGMWAPGAITNNGGTVLDTNGSVPGKSSSGLVVLLGAAALAFAAKKMKGKTA